MMKRTHYLLIVIVAIATSFFASRFFSATDSNPDLKSIDGTGDSNAAISPVQSNRVDTEPIQLSGKEAIEPATLSDPVARGVFGSPIGDPYETYRSFIDDAQAGDANAQLQISRVLFDCKGLPTQSRLDELEAQAVLDRGMVEETQLRLDICIELINEIGNDAVNDWKNWLAASAEQGHPLALGRDMIFSPGKYSRQQADQIVRAVIRVPSVEIYSIVASYYVTYREDDLVQYEAWMTLACRQIPHCNINEYRGAGAEPLRPGEKKRVALLVDEIAAAINNGEWEGIEF